jgi:hypothetical protein
MSDRETIVAQLSTAFGGATDVTPADGQSLHVLFSTLELPAPWTPSPTRALSIWEGWPNERPRFVVDEHVVGEDGEPPRSSDPVYLIGEPWRQFSFSFDWKGDDPVHAIQRWLTRFVKERS